MNIRNNVQLVGHVGQTPEIKTFGTSGKLAKLSVATNESYKNKSGEWVDNTMWHNLIAWRATAERIEQQVRKGSYILIHGKLVQRNYTDKDGVKRYITEVEVNSFLVLDKKSNGNVTETSSTNSTQDFYQTSAKDDDLPF